MNGEELEVPKPDFVHTLIMKGGGIKGLAFTGAIRVLEENGYTFDTYVGTSAGGVAAVLLAAGYSAADLEKMLRKKSFKEFLDAPLPKAVVNLLAKGGLHPGRNLRNWVQEMLRAKFPSEVDYPIIYMKDFEDKGKRAIVFASHPRIGTITFDTCNENRHTQASHAVRLSSSIPGVFIPETSSGYRIYDGGLLNNFPIDVYKRVCKESPSHNFPSNGQDFIALYLGSPVGNDNAKHKWWLAETVDILLARDDPVTLRANQRNSLILDTSPIRTTEFNISDIEKEYLVEVGKCSALKFIRKPEASESCKKVAELRKKVESVRRKRAAKEKCKHCSVVAASVLIVIGAVASFSYLRTEQYILDESRRYVKAYVNAEKVTTSLEESASKELKGHQVMFGRNFAQNVVVFDSVVQVSMTRKQGAAKLTVWEGLYSKDQMERTIKITASSKDESPNQDGRIFVLEENSMKWVPQERCNWTKDQETSSGDGYISVKKTLPPGNCISENQRFRLVTVATYGNIFQGKSVAPWTLWAHRYLGGQNIKATYLMLAEPVSVVRYPSTIYAMEDSVQLREIKTPASGVYSDREWNALIEKIGFLGEEPIKKSFGDLQETIEEIQKLVLEEYELFKKYRDRQLIFGFDSDSTLELNRSNPINKLNLVVFVESKT